MRLSSKLWSLLKRPPPDTDEVIAPVIQEPRKSLSPYAPKMYRMDIDPDKIREVIGPGGKIINRIIDETGVKIDIEDDGRVFVSTPDEEAGKRAMAIIEAIAKDVQPGQVFLGKVTKIMNFGAFVEFAPGKEGLVHISKLDNRRVSRSRDVCKVGDEMLVKVLDMTGRPINLSGETLPENNSGKH